VTICTVKVGHWTAGAWVVDATLARANVEYVERTINEPWSASFSLHTLDPEALTYLSPDKLGGKFEVQVWRDTRCIFWGIPLQARCDMTKVTFACAGLLWYYTRRFFGPIQNHYGTNTDFESGTTGWTASGGVTFTASSTWKALGTQSAKLVSASAGADAYITQSHTTTTTTVPVFFAFKAMFHVAGTGWVGPALEERGLYLEVRNSGGVLVAGPVWEPLTNETPRDASKPYRLETGITVPAGLTNAVVHRRIYSPGGTIYVDATDIVTEESVGSAVTGDAANTIITRLNTYAQNAAQGKSDLNIGIAAGAGTFPTLVRIYQFFDNGNIWDALSEYPEIAACDLEIAFNVTTGATRDLKMWPGGKGASGVTVTLGSNVVEDWSYDVNAGAVVTAPRVLGQGDGADRELGVAVDTSLMGGLVLESVGSAPLEAPIDSLQRLADQALAAAKKPVMVPEFTMKAADVFGVFEEGQTIAITAAYGYWTETAVTRKVISLRYDGAKDAVAVRIN